MNVVRALLPNEGANTHGVRELWPNDSDKTHTVVRPLRPNYGANTHGVRALCPNDSDNMHTVRALMVELTRVSRQIFLHYFLPRFYSGLRNYLSLVRWTT